MMPGNSYEIDTEIRLGVTFYNVAANIPADPDSVALFVEDPSGNVITIDPSTIVRTGVGEYYANYLPPSPGCWKYKWQGYGNTNVIATSPDTPFFVKGSEFAASLNPN